MAESTELTLSSNDFSAPSETDQSKQEQKSGFLGNAGGMDIVRQITMIVALTICIAISLLIFFWMSEGEMRPLGTYETQELIQHLDYLDSQKQEYKLEGNTILVPSADYQKLRLGLSRAGLTKENGGGEEILMQDSGFGVSQRMEAERLKHSREQQLSRTIEEFQSIARARVLLAIPKENIFARVEKSPSATVMITAKGGKSIKDSEVDGIVELVASAVQGLEPSKVTVTDQNGRLLNSGSQDAASSRSLREYEIELRREEEYR